jgi:hypothetical protein
MQCLGRSRRNFQTITHLQTLIPRKAAEAQTEDRLDGRKPERPESMPRKRRKNGGGSLVEAGKATQFKAGNPGGPGRPATSKFADAARWLAAQIGARDKTNALRLAESCFKRAMNGSARHAELLLAYAEGRPRQTVEMSGPNGGAMRFESMSDVELDARLDELLKKFQEDRRKK